MVTLKKLLLLMSAMSSVTLVAMESKSEDVNNNNDQINPATSTIVAPSILPTMGAFPFKTFNVDNAYEEDEWQSLIAINDGGSSESLGISTKSKIYLKKPLIESIIRSKDMTLWKEFDSCLIGDSDNSLAEKFNDKETYSIIYLPKNAEKKMPPHVLVNRYADDDLGGLPVDEYAEQIKQKRSVIATAIYADRVAAYADSNNAIAISDINKKTWGVPCFIKHNHAAFGERYVTKKVEKEGKEEEVILEFPQNIKSLKFWDEKTLAVRTPSCIALLNIDLKENGFMHIMCFEAPEKGTGLVSGGLGGLLSPSEYSYQLAVNKNGETGLVRRANGNFDRIDRFSLDYSLSSLHSPQVAAIWMVTNILNTTKENVNKATMTATFKDWYNGKKLQGLPQIVQEQYRELIAKKANEVGISLK